MSYYVIDGDQFAAGTPWSGMADVAVGAGSDGFSHAPERAKAFAAAVRHSARVRFLRVALLVGALGAVALLIGVSVFDPFGRLSGSVSIAGIGLDGTRVVMEHPRLTGFRKDGRPYTVNAQKAVQDALHPMAVELYGIDADVALAGGGAAHVTANSGLYDSTKEHMDVSDNVRVKSPQYEVWLKSASIDFKSGLYVSNEPVKIVTSTGTTIAGDSITVVDNGKSLDIEGNVKTTIPPASMTADTKAQMKGTDP
jgi:lipopolysaccharide export system protein LptC